MLVSGLLMVSDAAVTNALQKLDKSAGAERGYAPHWPADVPLLKATNCFPPILTSSN
jgi:hypothetical protein